MSTRPIVPPPAWATALANNTEPSGAQKASGWNPNQDGISDYDNWWKETAWEWLTHFADRAWTGLISITGGLRADTVEVTGAITLDGELYHPEWTKYHSAGLGTLPATGVTLVATNHTVQIATTKTAYTEVHGPSLGDRIKKLILTGEDATTTFSFVIVRQDSDGGAGVPLAYTSSRLGAAHGPFEYTFTITTPLVIPAGSRIEIQTTSAGGTGTIYVIGAVWDRVP